MRVPLPYRHPVSFASQDVVDASRQANRCMQIKEFRSNRLDSIGGSNRLTLSPTGLPVNDRRQDNDRPTRRFGPALTFAYTFAGGIVFCTLGGVWLDRKFDSLPIFTISGIFLGLAYGFYELWKIVRWMERRESEDNDDSKPPPTDPS